MPRHLPALILLLLLAPVASASLQAGAAQSRGRVDLLAHDGWLAWSPAASPGLVQVSAESGTAHIIDDIARGVVTMPQSGPDEYAAVLRSERQTTALPGSGGIRISLGAPSRADALVLVLPGAGHTLAASAEAAQARPAVDLLLESSHRFSQGATPRPLEYYEYVFRSGVEARLEEADVELRGNLTLYVWGLPLTWETGASYDAVQTGLARSPAAGPAIDGFPAMVEDWHYVFAVLNLQGAVVRVHAPRVAAFADAFQVAGPGAVTYEGATGTVPVEGGDAAIQGGAITVSGASATWVLDEKDRLGVSFEGPVKALDGPVTLPPPPLVPPWAVPLSAGVVLAAMVGLAWSWPNLVGARSGEFVHAKGFRARRAFGYAVLRGRAQQAGHLAFAQWLSRCSLRWQPGASSEALAFAEILRERGLNQRALQAHRSNSEMLELQADAEEWAFNAFGAARCAAHLARWAEALHWLRLSIQADPGLAEDALCLADFVPLMQDPDFQSAVGGARRRA